MDVNEPGFPLMTSHGPQPTTLGQTSVQHRDILVVDAHLLHQGNHNSPATVSSMAPLESQQGSQAFSRSQEHDPGVSANPNITRQGQIDPYLFGPSSEYNPALDSQTSQFPPIQSYSTDVYSSYAPVPAAQSDQHGTFRTEGSGLSNTHDISNPNPNSPSVSSSSGFFGSLRNYHEEQTRQHSHALQHLTQGHEIRGPDGGLSRTENTPFSHPFGLHAAPSTATADGTGVSEYYQSSLPGSSIPMSKFNRLHDHRPSQNTHSLPSDSQPYQPLDQHVYSFEHEYTQSFRYQQEHAANTSAAMPAPDSDRASRMTNPGQGISQDRRDLNLSTFHAAGHPTPQTIAPTAVPGSSNASFLSTLDILRSGVKSNNNTLNMHQPVPSFDTSPHTSVKDTHSESSFSGASSTASSIGRLEPPISIAEEEDDDETIRVNRKRASRRKGIGDNIEGSRSSSTHSRAGKEKEREENSDERVVKRQMEAQPETSSTRATSVPLSDEESESTPAAKKRKKSKMHECEVCHKKFPRPSGLKTHMNTHNNERPFACGFPGCTRTFGVRSNAKRHLRTHGVIPQTTTGSPPYIVDFSTPVVLQSDGSGLSAVGPGGSAGSGEAMEGSSSGATVATPSALGRPGRGRGRQFKLRWMPPSSTTRLSTRSQGRKPRGGSSAIDQVGGPSLPQQLTQVELQEERTDEEQDVDAEADIDEGMDMDQDEDGEEDDDEEEDNQESFDAGHTRERSFIDQSNITGQTIPSFATRHSGSHSTPSSTRQSSSRSDFPSSPPTSAPRITTFSQASSSSASPILPPSVNQRGRLPEVVDVGNITLAAAGLSHRSRRGEAANFVHRHVSQVNHPFAYTSVPILVARSN